MLALTKEILKSHQDAKACYICGKKLLKSLPVIKIIRKLGTIAILQVNIEDQYIVFAI